MPDAAPPRSAAVAAPRPAERPTVRWTRSMRSVHATLTAAAVAMNAVDICRVLLQCGDPHPLRNVYRTLDRLETLGLLTRTRHPGRRSADRDEWQLAADAPPAPPA